MVKPCDPKQEPKKVKPVKLGKVIKPKKDDKK